MPHVLRRFHAWCAALAFAATLLLTGCSPSMNDARTAMNAVTLAYNEVNPRLLAAREEQGQACLDLGAPADKACVAEVRKRWAPIRAASEKVHASIIAALAVLHTAEASIALGQQVDAAHVLGVVLRAVEAVSAFRDLVAPPAAPAVATAPAQPAPSVEPDAPPPF